MSDESENYVFRRSATVAQLPVKQLVAGSNPAAGAKEYDTNSLFLGEIVFSRARLWRDGSAAPDPTGLFSAAGFPQFSL